MVWALESVGDVVWCPLISAGWGHQKGEVVCLLSKQEAPLDVQEHLR
jgi:hypothetical protein